MTFNLTGDRGALTAALAGATAALVLAVLIPAYALLAIEAIAIGGTYAYQKYRKPAGQGETIEAEYKEVHDNDKQ